MSDAPSKDQAGAPARSYVTVEVGGQTFGVAIERVREVFAPGRLTKVPLAPPEVAGVLNLRGRIVTAIDMRAMLGLPPAPETEALMAVGIDHKTEAFALVVDRVGDVLDIADATREPTPQGLDPRWASLAECVHRLPQILLVILNVDRAINAQSALAA